MPDILLIRADASPRIGTGHVMRCLALAQQWQRHGGRVVFAQAETTPALAQRLQAEGMETSPLAVERGSPDDAMRTVEFARTLGAPWVVADGYVFGTPWQKRIKDAGLRLLVIDDYGHTEHYHADLILNQNALAAEGLYQHREPATRLLLGPRYALLRREFLACRDMARVIPPVGRKILVTLGGGDPDNVTGTVIEALAQLPDTEAVVVVGGSNPNLDAVKQAIARQDRAIRLVVDAANMPELMAWADVAVSAAGSTAWELAYMGLPSGLIVVADNQARIAEALARERVSVNLGGFPEITTGRIATALRTLLQDALSRRDLSGRARQLIDGHGARRVTAALDPRLKLSIVSDADSWLNAFLGVLKTDFEKAGHHVRWIHDPKDIEEGDLAFFLSLSRIVCAPTLNRNSHNLVVHESALPCGRGWSPLTWQILEGKSEVPVSLLEAAESVDSGPIYAQDLLRFTGGELVDELRIAQAGATIRLCRDFVGRYPYVCSEGRAQTGEASFHARRRPEDSRLDPDKSLREQFNLLRVADPDRYPGFFELAGRRYEIRLRATDKINQA